MTEFQRFHLTYQFGIIKQRKENVSLNREQNRFPCFTVDLPCPVASETILEALSLDQHQPAHTHGHTNPLFSDNVQCFTNVPLTYFE